MWNFILSSNNASGKGKNSQMVIDDIYVQFQTSSDHFNAKPVLPTVLGEGGSLLYKFFDMNMFVVSAYNQDVPSEMTFYVINAVTGNVAHQWTEKNIDRNSKSEVSVVMSENVVVVAF